MTAFDSEVATILAEEELFFHDGEYRKQLHEKHMSDQMLCKFAFERWCERNYETKMADLPSLMEGVASLPCDLVPVGLFRAAMSTALEHVDWELVAYDEDVAMRLWFIRSKLY